VLFCPFFAIFGMEHECGRLDQPCLSQPLRVGEHETAIEQASRALRLSPVDPEGFRPECAIAMAHLFKGRRENALTWARKASGHRQGVSTILLMLVTALAGRYAAASRNSASACAARPRAVPAAPP